MAEHGFGSVPVLNKDHRLLGIVSEHDLLKVLMEDKPLSEVTAEEMMTPNPTALDSKFHVYRLGLGRTLNFRR